MPLKIQKTNPDNGNTNIIDVRQVLYNDNSHNNTDIRKIRYKESENAEPIDRWVRTYNIQALNASSYIDESTVSAKVISRNDCAETSNLEDEHYVILNNEAVLDNNQTRPIFYEDSIVFTASPKKGYAEPTINNIGSVNADVNLNNQIISTGEVINISMPEIVSVSTMNTQTGEAVEGGPIKAVIKNNNNFECTVYYYIGSTYQNTPPFLLDAYGVIGPKNSSTETLEIELTGASSYSKLFNVKFTYGAATTEWATQVISTTSGDATITSSSNYISYPEGTTSITLTANSNTAIAQDATWSWKTSNSSVVSLGTISGARNQQIVINAVAYSKSATITATARNGRGIVAIASIDIWVTKNTGSSGGGGGTGGCVSYDSKILLPDYTTKLAEDVKIGDMIAAYNSDHEIISNKINNIYVSYASDTLYKLNLENGNYIKITPDHPILTNNGYKNIDGVKGYEKLDLNNDKIYTLHGILKPINVEVVLNSKRVYNFYTDYDNFIADEVIVACENPDDYEINKNCFIVYEGSIKNQTTDSATGTTQTTGPWDPNHGTGTTDHSVIDYYVVKHYDPINPIFENGCVSHDSKILLPDYTTKLAEDVKIGDMICSVDERGNVTQSKVLNIYFSDYFNSIYKLYLDGFTISLTSDHPILTNNGYKNIDGVKGYEKLDVTDMVYTTAGYRHISSYKQIKYSGRVYNFYTDYDNFIADEVIVACENPDEYIDGVNCFVQEEGVSKIPEGGGIGDVPSVVL